MCNTDSLQLAPLIVRCALWTPLAEQFAANVSASLDVVTTYVHGTFPAGFVRLTVKCVLMMVAE